MITWLHLTNFKNFRDARVELGPLSLVVGTNASGKSNLRDAFRFAHGVSRGYLLAEIIGERWVEGGVLQWRGIRGGSREATLQGQPTFAIEVGYQIDANVSGEYRIEVEVGGPGEAPRVGKERLQERDVRGEVRVFFDSHPDTHTPDQADVQHIVVRARKQARKGFIGPAITVLSNQPVLSQLRDHRDATAPVREAAARALHALSSMRFLDLHQEAMRRPSLPGQTVLGDLGENLSSVLQAICADPGRKAILLDWIRDLTPLDAVDFKFVPDQTGKVLVTLVEASGQETSAYSASDGTLRFLAMIAALLGPEKARFYFFEELENGIHPTRLHLLLQLIEQWTQDGGQMVATSHSPQLLGFLSESSREAAVLVYRLAGENEAHAARVVDLPNARRLLSEGRMAALLATGWLEDAAQLVAGDEP